MKQRNKESFDKRFKTWIWINMNSTNLNWSAHLFLKLSSILLCQSWYDVYGPYHHNVAFVYVYGQWIMSKIFIVFLLIYVAYHVTLYFVVETSALHIKSIMNSGYRISISVQSQIYHILNIIITDWEVTKVATHWLRIAYFKIIFLVTVGHFLKLLLIFYRNNIWW